MLSARECKINCSDSDVTLLVLFVDQWQSNCIIDVAAAVR